MSVPNNHYETKQVIVMRKDLNMRKGELCAQAAHASLAAYKQADHSNEAFRQWNEGSFAKITLHVESEEELVKVYTQAKEANLNVSIIADAGVTEFHGVPTLTCICIGPDYANKIDPITGNLKLF